MTEVYTITLTVALPKGRIIDSRAFFCDNNEECAKQYCESLNKVITEEDFIQIMRDMDAVYSVSDSNPVFYNYDWSFKEKLDFTSDFKEKYGNYYVCLKNLTNQDLIIKVRDKKGVVRCAIVPDGDTAVIKPPSGYLATEEEYKRYQRAILITNNNVISEDEDGDYYD